jgi:streptogramin lyase
MGRIFVSYRHADAAVLAGCIYDAMAARFGRRHVFRDTEDIPVGARFPEFLHKTLHQCQVAFILIGPSWLSATHPDGTRRLDDPNDFVRVEVETALARGLLVCPLLLDGAAMPAAEDLPPSIREVHWHQALPIHSAPTDFAQDMDRLAADIKRAVEGKGGTLVERFALLGRTTAIPLAAGAVEVVVGATAAKGGKIGDLLAKGCSTMAAKVTAVVAAVAVATTVVVAVAHPALLPFAPGRSRVVSTAPAQGGPDATRTATLGPAGSIREFAVPTSASTPLDIALGPDGNLWFTEEAGDKIGRITPTGSITEFPLPTRFSFVTGIVSGADGNLWFTEYEGNTVGKIGRITPAGSITEFPVPTVSSRPFFIARGPDGNLWFTEFGGNKIGRVTPTGSITEFAIPTPSSYPIDIASGPDGNLWFTEGGGSTGGGNKIGRITPTGGISEFPIPTPASYPYFIASGDCSAPGRDEWATGEGGLERLEQSMLALAQR